MAISRAMLMITTSLISIAVLNHAAHGQCTYDWQTAEGINGINGWVQALIKWDPDGAGPKESRLYAAGSFTVAGKVQANNIAAWSGDEWETLGLGLNGTVYELLIYNNELVAVGTFSQAGGANAAGAARWNGTNWTSMGSPANAAGVCAAQYSGDLYIGDLSKLWKYDGTSWTSYFIPGEIWALASFGGKLIVGGNFSPPGLPVAQVIASWNGTQWQLLGNLRGAMVKSLAEFRGELIAGGSTLSFGSTNSDSVARWNGITWQTSGQLLHAEQLECLFPFNDRLIAGGALYLPSNGGFNSTGMSQWDGTNWSLIATTGNSSAWVSCAIDYEGDLVVGGAIGRLNGRNAYGIMRRVGSTWAAFPTGFSGTVYSMSEYQGDLVVGGGFFIGGGIEANCICRWNGAEWKPFGSGMDSTVFTLVEHEGNLVAGGYFKHADGFPANFVARWNGVSWESMGSGFDGPVWALAVHKGSLVAAGQFENSGDTPVNYIARWDGSDWQPMDTGFDDVVTSLVVYKGDLVAGGAFRLTGDWKEFAGPVARWDGAHWSQLDGGKSYSVDSLVIWNDRLVGLGSFHIHSPPDEASVALWNGAEWEPLATDGFYFARSLFVANGELIATGFFTPPNGSSWDYAKRWNGSEWITIGSPTQPSQNQSHGEVWSAAYHNGDLFLGGSFERVGQLYSARFAKLSPTGPAPTITQHPTSPLICQGSTISLRSTATGDGALSYQWRKNGIDLTDDEDTFGTQSPALAFAHASASDAGTYDCLVKLNNCTQATSNTATLSVFPTNTADGNLDGHTDARDIAVFVDALVNFAPVSAPLCAYDLTGEGIVNPDDIPPFVTRLLSE